MVSKKTPEGSADSGGATDDTVVSMTGRTPRHPREDSAPPVQPASVETFNGRAIARGRRRLRGVLDELGIGEAPPLDPVDYVHDDTGVDPSRQMDHESLYDWLDRLFLLDGSITLHLSCGELMIVFRHHVEKTHYVLEWSYQPDGYGDSEGRDEFYVIDKAEHARWVKRLKKCPEDGEKWCDCPAHRFFASRFLLESPDRDRRYGDRGDSLETLYGKVTGEFRFSSDHLARIIFGQYD